METVPRPGHFLIPCRSAIQYCRGSPDRQNILKEAPFRTVVARWFRALLNRQAVQPDLSINGESLQCWDCWANYISMYG